MGGGGQGEARGAGGAQTEWTRPERQKGFGYSVHTAQPSGRGNDTYTESILSFLREAEFGKVKAGALDRDAR